MLQEVSKIDSEQNRNHANYFFHTIFQGDIFILKSLPKLDRGHLQIILLQNQCK